MATMSDDYISQLIASGPEQVGQMVYDMAVEIQQLRVNIRCLTAYTTASAPEAWGV